MFTLITGASSGIGEACARKLASTKKNVVLFARRQDRLARLSQELVENHGISAPYFSVDIRDRSSIQNSFQKHPEIFESIESLINNAGMAKGLDPLQKGNPEDWETVIDTNIKGLLNITRMVLPQMVSRKSGHVVNVGSVAGHWVYENGAVYCASKFAVRALTEGLRFDLQGTGIRVTEISPGMVKTEFSGVRYGDKERGEAVYKNRAPLSADDIAETILWCMERPAHVNIQEVIIYPTEQASVHTKAR